MTIRLFADGKLIPECNYELQLAWFETDEDISGYRIIYHEESGFDSNSVLELIEIPDAQPGIVRVMMVSIFDDVHKGESISFPSKTKLRRNKEGKDHE